MVRDNRDAREPARAGVTPPDDVAVTPQRTFGLGLTAAGLLAVLALTLQPVDDRLAGPVAKGWCLICGDVGLADFFLNCALFVPFGMGLRLAGVSWRWTIAACAALTLSIELAQMSLVTGRDASAGDLVANTAGGIAGALLGTYWPRVLLPAPRASRTLAWISAACAAGIVALSAIAMRPFVPAVPLWGQIAPRLGQFDHFEGLVLGATVSGETMPSARFVDSGRARRALLADGAFVEALVRPAGPPYEIAPIVSIFDGRGREILVLGQTGRALFFRLRRVSSEGRVSTPGFALADVFPAGTPTASATDSVRIRAAWSGNTIRLSASSASMRRGRDITVHPLLGWRLFYPFTYDIGRDLRVASIAWLAALLLPVAYWSRRAGLGESHRLAWLPLLTATAIIGATTATASARLAALLVPAAALGAIAAAACVRAAAGTLDASRG